MIPKSLVIKSPVIPSAARSASDGKSRNLLFSSEDRPGPCLWVTQRFSAEDKALLPLAVSDQPLTLSLRARSKPHLSVEERRFSAA
jgi:hypothetical protein